MSCCTPGVWGVYVCVSQSECESQSDILWHLYLISIIHTLSLSLTHIHTQTSALFQTGGDRTEAGDGGKDRSFYDWFLYVHVPIKLSSSWVGPLGEVLDNLCVCACVCVCVCVFVLL